MRVSGKNEASCLLRADMTVPSTNFKSKRSGRSAMTSNPEKHHGIWKGPSNDPSKVSNHWPLLHAPEGIAKIVPNPTEHQRINKHEIDLYQGTIETVSTCPTVPLLRHFHVSICKLQPFLNTICKRDLLRLDVPHQNCRVPWFAS